MDDFAVNQGRLFFAPRRVAVYSSANAKKGPPPWTPGTAWELRNVAAP